MTAHELAPQAYDSQALEETAKIETLWASKAPEGAICLPTDPAKLARLLISLAEAKRRLAEDGQTDAAKGKG